jgi:hypothetical protein
VSEGACPSLGPALGRTVGRRRCTAGQGNRREGPPLPRLRSRRSRLPAESVHPASIARADQQTLLLGLLSVLEFGARLQCRVVAEDLQVPGFQTHQDHECRSADDVVQEVHRLPLQFGEPGRAWRLFAEQDAVSHPLAKHSAVAFAKHRLGMKAGSPSACSPCRLAGCRRRGGPGGVAAKQDHVGSMHVKVELCVGRIAPAGRAAKKSTPTLRTDSRATTCQARSLCEVPPTFLPDHRSPDT